MITIFSSKRAAHFLKKTLILYGLANPSEIIAASFDVAYSLVCLVTLKK